MKAEIFDGKKLAEKLRRRLRRKTDRLKQKPLIVSLSAGDAAASRSYIARQEKSSREAGMEYRKIIFPSSVSEKTIIKKIESLNKDKKVTGIIVLLPLPAGISTLRVHRSIRTDKDIEGVNPDNTGLLARGGAVMPPCTAAAVMEILRSAHCCISGKNAVIVGCSDIVGKPLAMMLLAENATVTVCNVKTEKLSSHTKKADILVAAAGVRKLIKASMIKQGAVVIDVGFNAAKHGICGDVDFKAVSKKASFITPVPGGVGPVTAYQLLLNAARAAELQK